MRLVKNTSKSVVAILVSALIIISMLPISMFAALAAGESALETDITEKTFYADVATEFTFTTKASDEDAGKTVLGSFTLLDANGADARTAVKTLEYWDVTAGEFREFYGDFGPATGFPLTDNVTSRFRVTFNKAGTYTVKAAMINPDDRIAIVSAKDSTITVKPYASELTTDIDTKTFVNNTAVEFTYTTVANAQANTMVLGTFSVLDSANESAQSVIKLEYWDVTAGEFREFYGDFGPANTGFPLTDATSRFRVTFSKAGTYTVNAAMKKFADGEILCTNSKTISVQPNNCILSTDINEKSFEINGAVEFTYTTKANDFKDTTVLGKFTLVDENGIEVSEDDYVLEYWDVAAGEFRAFYGAFGPAEGFPLSDATSRFCATLKKTGKYTVTVQMVSGETSVAENTATIEVKDTLAPVISSVAGNATDWTSSNVTLEVLATDNSGAVSFYRMDDGEWQESNKFTVTENGKHVFYAKDAAGNESVVSAETEVKLIDKTAPEITLLKVEPDAWTKGAVAIRVTATDAGVNEILYKMDEGEWQTKNYFVVNDNLTHKFYVKDSVGNVNPEASEIRADKHDTTAPTITDIVPDTTDWVSDKVEFTVLADDGDGIGKMLYKVDDGAWQSTNKKYTVTENGTYKVYVKDQLGNENPNAQEIVISNIDKSKPVIESLVSSNENWTNGNVVLSGVVKDTVSGKNAVSGVASVYYKKDKGEWQEITVNADGSFSLTVTDECNAAYTFKCVDKAGNESADTLSKTVLIDKTPATVAVNAVTDKWMTNSIRVSGLVSDTASKVKKGVYDNGKGDKGELSIVGSDFYFDTNITVSGEYTYTLTFTDNAGNEVTAQTAVVKMDFDNPTVSVEPKNEWTNSGVTVTVSANDANAGVRAVYYKVPGKDTVEVEKIDGEYKFNIPATANNNIDYMIYCIDDAGRRSASVYFNPHIDITKPQQPTITYSKALRYRILEMLTFGVYDAPVTVSVKSKDDLSGLKEIKYYIDGNETVATPDAKGTVSFEISANNQVKISAVAVDIAGNVSDEKNKGTDGATDMSGVIVDNTKPEISASADVTEWTSGMVVLSGTVSDNLSKVESVFYLKGDSETPQRVPIFNRENNSFELKVLPQSYQGKYYFYCVDYAGNVSEKASVDVLMDNVIPTVESAQVSITDWTNQEVTVTGKVSDNLSGVAKVYWRQGGKDTTEREATLNEDGTYNITISARDYKGLIHIGCYDVTGNKAREFSVAVQMDITKPVVTNAGASTTEWTNEKITIKGTVADVATNGVQSRVKYVKFAYDTVTEDDAVFNATKGTFNFEIPATNFDGEVSVWCIDEAGNVSDVSKVRVRMDVTKPAVTSGVATPAEWTSEKVVISGKVFDETVNGAVSEVKTVMYEYDGKEAKKATLTGTDYTFEIPEYDYKGDVTIWCIDNAGNVSDDFKVFVKMDNTAPTDVEIKYTDSIWNKIINTLTFGFYNLGTPLTVTITAEDNLSLEEIEYFCEGTEGVYDDADASANATVKVSAIERNAAGDITKGYIEFDVPAQYKGTVRAIAYDSAKNSTAQNENVDEIDTVIVDAVAPEINVSYEAVDENTKVSFVDSNMADVDSFAAGAQVFYNGNATATITIDETNFFEGEDNDGTVIHEVGILLTETDNDGNVTTTEYLPAGADKLFADVDKTVEFDWTSEGSVHKYTITYDKDADYVITVKYTDFSKNKADITANDGQTATETYTSKIVTVDKTSPIVSVEYKNNDVKAKYGDREYYVADQSAVITVTEHNFRADDFKAQVAALYSDGTAVSVEDFAATLSDDSKWTKNGNVYTITINYTVDANYTFYYDYDDLAGNYAAAYEADEFTVDKQDPHTHTVTYVGDVKKNLTDKILEYITFGYYDAKVKVVITANDDVSGIDHFVYSYIKSEGVSGVNAGLENVVINRENITQNGKTFTASFEIPKEVLQNTNQFNGKVKFTSFDRSTRNSEHKETHTVIVDNIAPTATVEYNAPVKNENGISYYAGNVDAKITVNEANFFSEDVKVKVNDVEVAVNWVDESVDVHIGTFTLSADGDYVVTVEYKDRSENAMNIYKSNQLTIDTKVPVVTVDTVKQNSANKDATYTFTITAEDTNLDSRTFVPTFTAVVMDENGSFKTKTVTVDALSGEDLGKKGQVTIPNLTDDAIYSLSCVIKDMSDNECNVVTLSSDSKEYEKVQFSINRKGSTYGIGEYTKDVIEKYYVQNVTENVVLVETNVDTLGEYTVTLNGKELTENTDYTVTHTGGNGSWMKYTYSVNKELFAEEGEYKVVVSSKDKALNDAFSDVKDATINFVVDRTAPVVTISGMATDGRYKTDSQTVSLIPTDDGGALKSIIVRLVDRDGKEIKELVNLSGDAFAEALENGGKIDFVISKGLYQNVQIICNDCAVDADGNTNTYDETVKNISVNSNGFMIFWANKPLRWGSIGGVVAVAAAVLFIVFKKRKK